MRKLLLPALALLALPLLCTQIGCESSDDASGNYWQSSTEEAAPLPSQPTEAPAGDAVSFGALNFCYGGFNGAGASYSPAQIGGLRVSGDTLSFSWTGPTLAAWGLGDKDVSGALACLFVQKSDGSWVGGKFDWISTSRTSRHLENVFHGYCGWSLHGVPNPCNAAFVIVSPDAKRRSNVISTSWKR